MSDVSDRYDAVVVGGGLGGLAAAARLSRAGMRVLVAERHDRLGGYASTFVRDRFELEVALHLVDAMHEGEPNHALLVDLGIDRAIEWLRPAALRREIWPDREIVVPHGRDAYLDALASHFPTEREGLARLFAIASEVAGAYHAGGGEVLDPLGPLARSSAARVVDAQVRDPALRATLSLFAHGWLGLSLEALGAISFLVPWCSYHRYGGSYPRGGSPAIVDALASIVTRAGGALRVSTGARRIHVERRRVSGVTFESGERVATRLVVSNASPQATIDLLDDRDVRWSAKIDRLRGSVSCLKVWLGLSSADEAWRDYDLYRVDERGEALSITMPHVLTGGPPVIAITKLVETSRSVTRADADALVAEAERALPTLRDRVVLREVATPSTFARFTGNPGGSIYGARAMIAQSGARHLPHATPFDGLWMAGAWVQPGAGFSTVLRSGRDAANEALR
ncbi:MAG: NAD(P)/FAD-dependent oxidoreductase [Labilithrix sp.]|nr:NAD(P)/FAD-dependent oxidoreductase [Labilithrix sp.]